MLIPCDIKTTRYSIEAGAFLIIKIGKLLRIPGHQYIDTDQGENVQKHHYSNNAIHSLDLYTYEKHMNIDHLLILKQFQVWVLTVDN